jgi:hypothetical protein
MRSYLRDLRRAVTRDIPAAKAAILGQLDGDLVLAPATADQPARETGGIQPAGLLGVRPFIAGACT